MSTHEAGDETPADPGLQAGAPDEQPGAAPPDRPYGDAIAGRGAAADWAHYGEANAGRGAAADWAHYGPISQGPQLPYEQAPTLPAPQSHSHRLRNGLVAAAVLLVAAGGGVAIGRTSALTPSSTSASTAAGSSALPGSTGSSGSSSSSGSSTSTGVGAGGGSLNATAISAKVDPALVDIDVVLGYESESAAGTGIVLSANGEVVTNNHVVDGATSIHVTDIGNGKTYTAEIVGTDATSDIAVIQLEGASGLATANLGNSSSLKSDEPVLAIGNAGGTGGTPSTAAGEVVALNQSITATDDSGANSENLSGLVETDAPIEPGDSGGPLVNSSAQVLAIDTAASAGNQFQSASTEAYAIPIDTALSIADAIESGQASSTIHIGEAAMIGVEVETASEASGSSASGAYIAAIIPGTPAASAGLVAGEVIVSLNGQAVDSPSALSSLMSSHHPGDRVTIGYDNSSGQLETLTLTLAAGPPA
jgi:S1-C subfamily serine protease